MHRRPGEVSRALPVESGHITLQAYRGAPHPASSADSSSRFCHAGMTDSITGPRAQASLLLSWRPGRLTAQSLTHIAGSAGVTSPAPTQAPWWHKFKFDTPAPPPRDLGHQRQSVLWLGNFKVLAPPLPGSREKGLDKFLLHSTHGLHLRRNVAKTLTKLPESQSQRVRTSIGTRMYGLRSLAVTAAQHRASQVALGSQCRYSGQEDQGW